jgi:hypothetical protein
MVDAALAVPVGFAADYATDFPDVIFVITFPCNLEAVL